MSDPNIELVGSPPTISLLDDGIVFTVESKRKFNGVLAKLYINMSAIAADYLDSFMTISFLGTNIPFYFRLEPDQSGNELTTWLGGDTFLEFLAKVADEINLNFLFSNSFTAAVVDYMGSDVIQLIALETGSDYNITLIESDITGVNINIEVIGVNSSMPDDYNIFFSPFLFADPDNPLGKELVSVDNDMFSKSDLTDYLNGELETQFTYPFNGVISRTLPNAVKKYFINYAEFEDDNVQLLRTTYNDPKYVIRGGLIRIDADFFSNESGNYFEYSGNINRFLNWAPQVKITYPGVPERLYFLKTTTGDLIVKLKITYLSAAIDTMDLATITDDAYSIFELAVGLPEILTTKDGTTVDYYEIWLENDSTELLSETRKFLVDQTEYLNKRILFFKNSFDVYETICCTGELTTDDMFAREEIEVRKGPKFHRVIKETSWTKAYTLSTGWLPGKEYRNWLTEVLLSKDTFFALGHFLLPVIINNKKVWREKSRNNLYSIKFEFEADFNESRYSSIVGDGAYFLLDENGVVLLDENEIGLIAS